MPTPTRDYRRTEFKVPKRPPKGMDAIVDLAVGAYKRRRRVLNELSAMAERIEAVAPEWDSLATPALQQRLGEYREIFRREPDASEDVLVPAMAAVREAADRKLGMRPFFVQIIGALGLHRGFLCEMATGEGKTLIAGLAGVRAGWTRRPCHILTVNDYLVQRDADWMRPLYEFCGLRAGCVTAKMEPWERRQNYDCDVTYCTSKELLADFLRDRLHLGRISHPSRRLIRRMLARQAPGDERLVMRGLHTAIVDEADSILIDEAVTPLIISTSHGNDMLHEACRRAHDIAREFVPKTHYTVNLRYKEVELTETGRRAIEEQSSGLPGFWRGTERSHELVRQALTAREFFHLDKQYIIADGKVVIVDEFTGRPMPQRTWREGLHQFIEAKEDLRISDPSETLARLSFQRFFRCFHHLSGMTGTAREAAAELWRTYRLAVVPIPTNKPCIRNQMPDRCFADENSKWLAIVEAIVTVHATRRPLLVGTRSVAASERLAEMLIERGLEFELINAVKHHEEAQIVANAGHEGRITIATNMAGRGTDIRLAPGVAEMGGLHVIATERHESGRVDRQLFGRSARQGDPGSAQAFVSSEDELLRRYLAPHLRKSLVQSLKRNLPGSERMTNTAFVMAQRNAQHLAYRQRRAVLRADLWLDEALSFAGADAA